MFEEKPPHSLESTVHPSLRGFASLGWIGLKGEYIWSVTGHVLVMDMDRGRICHPWLVLAYEWPHRDEEGAEEYFLPTFWDQLLA